MIAGEERMDRRGVAVAAGAVLLVVLLAGIAVRGMSARRGLSRIYEYSAAELAEIPEHLIAYDERADSLDTGLVTVTDFCLDEHGRILVAGDRAVRVFERDGTPAGEILTPQPPTAVAIGEDARIYVALGAAVAVYGPGYELLDIWAAPAENALIVSIAVDGGNVLLADAGARVVRRYDTDGNFLNLIGARDPDRNVPGIVLPGPCFAVAVGEDGLLRVSNPGRHRVEVYTLRGDLVSWWGRASGAIDGFAGCCNPADLAVLPGDDGYVTAEKGLIRVKIFDADGVFRDVVAGPEQLAPGSVALIGQRSPEIGRSEFKVSVCSEGVIFVLDPLMSRVRFFEKRN